MELKTFKDKMAFIKSLITIQNIIAVAIGVIGLLLLPENIIVPFALLVLAYALMEVPEVENEHS